MPYDPREFSEPFTQLTHSSRIPLPGLNEQLRFYFPGLKEHLQTIRAFAPLGWPLPWRPARGWAHHRWPPPGIQNVQTPPVGQVETIWETLKIALLNGTDQRVPRPRRIESALPIEKPSAPLPKLTDSLLPRGFHCLQGKKTGQALSFPQTPQHNF